MANVEPVGAVHRGGRDRACGRIRAHRFGDPGEVGDMRAFLHAASTGQIIDQNLLLDGGQFPGLLRGRCFGQAGG
jgi:NAD(P)-dependent dehydrogenase (short-subunit alcohol dehydrogenase family)